MKELTFAEAVKMLREIEEKYPNADRLEILAEAYNRGYEAAKTEKGEA